MNSYLGPGMIYFGAEGRQLRRSPPHLARCCDDGESERYHNTSCYLAPKEGRRDGGVEMLGPYQGPRKAVGPATCSCDGKSFVCTARQSARARRGVVSKIPSLAIGSVVVGQGNIDSCVF